MPENTDSMQHETGRGESRSPGEILREAREDRNLTRNDVAAKLNLQVDTIVALEEGDHDKLPVSTYVRGYLRTYARLVKLDGEELVRRYDDEAFEPPEIIPDVRKHSQASSRDKPVKAFTYLVTFGLALLLLAWLQSQYIVDDRQENESTSQDTAGGGDPGYPINIVVHPDTPYFDNRTDTDDDYPPLYDEEPGVSGEGSDSAMPDALLIDETIPESRQSGPAAASGDEARQVAGADIVLEVKKESWIEVHDGGGNRLYLGLAKPGETLRLDGQAPYSVLLGYSPGVEVLYQGKPFNTEPYSDKGVARFKLGKSTGP